MSIDKHSSLPLYDQIKQLLRDRIMNGELRPGDMVPPERLLAETYRVSRMTSRKAIDDLAREGLVKREQGRGTYVSMPRIQKEVARFNSFTEDMLMRGMVPSSRLITFQIEKARPEIAKQLHISEHDDVYYIFRLRSADMQPMALERAYLPVHFFPGLERYDLEGHSLYEIVQRKYKLSPGYAEHSIQVARLTKAESGLLEVKTGDPGLQTNRTLYDIHNRPIEYTISIFHPDRYQYVVKLYP